MPKAGRTLLQFTGRRKSITRHPAALRHRGPVVVAGKHAASRWNSTLHHLAKGSEGKEQRHQQHADQHHQHRERHTDLQKITEAIAARVQYQRVDR